MLLQPSHAFLGPFAAHIVVYVSGATLVVHIVVALPKLAGLGFGQRFLVLVVVSAVDILPRMNAGDSRILRFGFLFATTKQERRGR